MSSTLPATTPKGSGSVTQAMLLPRMPHPLLQPTGSAGAAALAAGYAAARAQLVAQQPDLLVIYSVGWHSILGHLIQTDPRPRGTHVDDEFHALGTIAFDFPVDVPFSTAVIDAARARGLHARGVNYTGFPIDTGSLVAIQLLNPDGALPVAIVSCNVYADRAETMILGKSVRDAIVSSGKRVAVAAVSNLTHRLFSRAVAPEADRISSRQDDEWNQKLLEIFAEGRLEDVSQLARTFAAQARADARLKAVWWLAAAAGAHNGYRGQVLAYAPIQGAGCAVVSLQPDAAVGGQLEFDEDDVDVFRGDRGVLSGGPNTGRTGVAVNPTAAPPSTAHPSQIAPPRAPPSTAVAPSISTPTVAPTQPVSGVTAPSPSVVVQTAAISTTAAPTPVGAYPHARRVGDLLFLSGVGPRQPGTNQIPGGPVRDAEGRPLPYDAAAQTRAVIENVRRVLEAAGGGLEDILDVTAFLIDMDRDFAAYNAVYNEVFASIGATRTTLAITALPTPIAVEFKVLAAARGKA